MLDDDPTSTQDEASQDAPQGQDAPDTPPSDGPPAEQADSGLTPIDPTLAPADASPVGDPTSTPGVNLGSAIAETLGIIEAHLADVDTVRTALGNHVPVSHLDMDRFKRAAGEALLSLRRLS